MNLIDLSDLLLLANIEVLASLQSMLMDLLAVVTLELEHNLLCGLSLLVENRLGLTTITLLLSVVTSLTLSLEGSLTNLVLSDLVLLVGLAVSVGTVCVDLLWEVDLSFVKNHIMSINLLLGGLKASNGSFYCAKSTTIVVLA